MISMGIWDARAIIVDKYEMIFLSPSLSLLSKTVVDCLYRGHRSSFPRVPPAAYCVVLFDQDGYSMIRPPIVNGCPKASFHAPKDLSMYVVYSSSE